MQAFGFGEVGHFTRKSADEESGDAGVERVGDVALQARRIDLVRLGEGGVENCDDAVHGANLRFGVRVQVCPVTHEISNDGFAMILETGLDDEGGRVMAKASELQQLPNIGVTLAKKLSAIGIESERDLKKIGPAKAYMKLCLAEDKRLPVCYYLYSLHGALHGKDWRDLTDKEKDRLRNAVDQ